MKIIRVWDFLHKNWGKVFKKISDQLRKHAPANIEWVENREESDLQLIPVIGSGEFLEAKKCSRPIIWQHCYYTANHEHVDYPSLWEKSPLVMSFHPLDTYTDKKFNFYRTPLGADPTIYKATGDDKSKLVFTTGHVAETECIDLLYEACKRINGCMFHTGENFQNKRGWLSKHYQWLKYMSEEELSNMLSQCKYVLAARLVEGFEVMGVEALLAGTRPIVPDLPTYDFYKGFAEFINPNLDITEQLAEILKKEPRPFSSDEFIEIHKKFDWANIAKGIYSEWSKLI
jgi:glycosyltransferase involved in cell wall biosynthesis